ncbi:MAG: Gfo/Idh/MocA family oxidoreductase [Balneolales bacterium]
MSQKKLGVGIVGCGTIAGIHAEALKNVTNGRLVASFSRNQNKVDEFARKFGGEAFTDYDKFLANDELDVVAVCTPNGTHLDFGTAAADAGKHVIVEKPIDITTQRGRRLIEDCRNSKVKLAVIYQSRFADDINRMKQVVDDGTLGKMFMASATVKWFRDQKYFTDAPWRGTLALDGGGVMINQAIHTIDLLTWFAGDVEYLFAVKGTLTHEGIEGEDNVVASLQFKNGAMGMIQASTSMVPPMNRSVEINGTKGTALLEGDLFRLIQSEEDLAKKAGSDGASGSSSPLAGFSENNHKKQYDQIMDAILEDKEPVVSGEDSLKSLAIVNAIYASAERKQPVYMKEFLDVQV